MENTGKVLFEDDSPQWYIALGDRWVGPLSASDVYEKVLKQEITWAHFVWKAGQPDWKRICDTPTFQGAVPALPTKSIQTEVKEASKPAIKQASRKAGPPPAPGKAPAKPKAAEPKIWFLYYNDSQFGPFSTEEISRFIRVGKIHGRVHIWRDGMEDWARLETLKSFGEVLDESRSARALKERELKSEGRGTTTRAAAKDKRIAPRRPLVAKILMANQESVIVAVCRDISVGGMQVLTDRIPGNVGARIKMNVSPAGGEKDKRTVRPFVAEGVIVRILEDGRGFSFRFDRLRDESRRAIEEYIDASGP